jgi:tRNA pseudouridine13 synthase
MLTLALAVVTVGNHWKYAFGPPDAQGRIRASADDFVVREELGFTASGEGQHLLVHVRKRETNTQFVARELARMAGVRPREVGYAGLKDRHAVAEQWFTIGLPSTKTQVDLSQGGAGFEVLSATPHHRKLRRGALARNRFEIRVTALEGGEAVLAERLRAVRERGVPNYFGRQRFGRDANNLRTAERMLLEGERVKQREQRSFAYSAARSFLFNELLSLRIENETWDRLVVGDLANLDGVGSVFAVDALDDKLERRVAELDLHPTGPLWGKGAPEISGAPSDWEARACGAHPFAAALVADGLEHARRALRLRVQDLEWKFERDTLCLRFGLTSGAFATSVLREILVVRDASSGDL